MTKTVITSDKAPAAIGTYSQAIKAGNTVYLSGQIPLDPKTMELVQGFAQRNAFAGGIDDGLVDPGSVGRARARAASQQAGA